MVEPVDLAMRFAGDHPEGAARILQSLDAAEAAAFLEACPVATAAALLEHMSPAAAGLALWTMRRAAAGRCLDAAAARPMALALRTLDALQAERLLKRGSAPAVRRIRRHLSLPEESVGSWVEQDVVAFGSQTTVGEALETLRTARGVENGVIFLIGERRKYGGLLTLSDLLRLGPGATLMRHRRPVPPLHGRTPLKAALQRSEWVALGVLPVVDRHERLIGALTRAGLSRGLERTAGLGAAGGAGDAVMAISTAYYEGLNGMLRTVLEPAAGPAKEEKRYDG